MKINFSDFFEIKADPRKSPETVTIYETGRIKVSKAILDKLSQKTVSMQMSKDFKTVLLIPEGDTLSVKKDGSFYAKHAVMQIDRRKVLFPIVYSLEWDEENTSIKNEQETQIKCV